MYAVIKTGGKQYKVASGDVLKIEQLPGEVGNEVVFDQVLAISDGKDVKLGEPFIAGGQVKATIRSHGRGKKVTIVKFRRRKHFRKQMGHRQNYTEVEVKEIVG